MGTKFDSIAKSGYNANAPADDGSTTANNQLTWAKHKEKLGDPIADQVTAIQSALETHFDESVVDTAINLTTTAAHHKRTINVTDAVTVSLGDAATMAVGYIVTIKNSHTVAITVDLATATDKLGGTVDGSISIAANQSSVFIINSSADGYLIGNPFSAVTATIAELNYSDGVTSNIQTQLDAKVSQAGSAVTGHVRAGNTQILSGANTSYAAFDVDGGVTENTWESIGPTGSSADNIWASLDDVPSTATILLVDVYIEISTGSSVGALCKIDIAQEGVTPSSDQADITQYYESAYHGSDLAGDDLKHSRLMIPLDSSQRFQARWFVSNEDNINILFYYRGFMTD